MIFNSKKSLAIKYGKEVNDTEYVLLGQSRINWVDSVKLSKKIINKFKKKKKKKIK